MTIGEILDSLCRNDITIHVNDLDNLLFDYLSYDDYQEVAEHLNAIREVLRCN